MTDYLIKEAAENQTELHGVIKFFNTEDNFGFIEAKEGDFFIMPNGIGCDIHLSMTTIKNSGFDQPPEGATEISFKVRLNRNDENRVFASWVKLISPTKKHYETIFPESTLAANTKELESYSTHSSENTRRGLKKIYTPGLRPSEIIQRVLTLVRDELKTDVKKIILDTYGNNWHEKLTKIRQDRPHALGRISKNINDWDSQAILTTVVAVWDPKGQDFIFARLLQGTKGLGFVQNLCHYRNEVAHEKEIDNDLALFVIENAVQLLNTARKTTANKFLKEAKSEFEKEISKDDKVTTNTETANKPNSNAYLAQQSETIDEANWDAGAALTRVYIGTTQGRAELLSLEQNPALGLSLVTLNNTMDEAAFSKKKAYSDFVKVGTGVIASRFGDGHYKARISLDIENGSSWKLGMFAAHCLHSLGKLAGEEDKAGAAIWLTGDISISKDLPVLPVEKIPRKIHESEDWFKEILGKGIDLTIVVPDGDHSALAKIETQIAGIVFEGRTPRMVAAKSCAQMCRDALNIRMPDHESQRTSDPPSSSHSQDEPEPRSPLWSVAGLAVAGLAAFILYSVMQTSSLPQQPPTVDLGVQWDKFD